MNELLRQSYYFVKPFIPRRFTIALRRKFLQARLNRFSAVWPINPDTVRRPREWRGWPDKKRFALVLTHDVESQEGRDKCLSLMEMEMSRGFRSSFNFVARQYRQDEAVMKRLVENGFEIGLHGLIHRGNLFRSREYFQRQVPDLRKYIQEWQVSGFRTPSMYHNLDWIHELGIQYDASTFDTDPFEPQSDGAGTIFPFFVHNNNGSGYVELPYTLPQDFAVFVLLKEKDTRIWRKKLDWIAANNGMALLITHPDYMNFSGERESVGHYSVKHYDDFLCYIKEYYEDEYWHALPKDMAAFWTNQFKSESGNKASNQIPRHSLYVDQRQTSPALEIQRQMTSPHEIF